VVVGLFGRSLRSGVNATLTRSGQPDIVGTSTTTSTKGDALHTTFDLTSRPDGLWDVGVAGAGGADVLAGAFRTIGALTIDSMYPSLGDKDATVPVTIYGSHLSGSVYVRMHRTNYPDIFGVGTVVSADGLSVQCALPLQTADLGVYDVDVSNGGVTRAVPGGFEVVTPLRILSLFPNAAPNTGTVQLTVGGAGFRAGAAATLVRAGEADIAGDVVSVNPAGTLLVARFDLLGRALGLWDLRVTNPGALPFTSGNVLTIVVGPAVASIDPHLGANNGPLAVVITGSNFDAGAAARLTRVGAPAIIGSAAVVAPDGHSLATTFDLNGRPTGMWDVEITNTSNVVGTLPAAFEIRVGPTVTGVSPTSALDASVVTLTLSGTGFVSATTAKLVRAGEPDIVGTSVAVAPDGTSLTGDFDIRGRTGGVWGLIVSNPDGTAGPLPNAFTIHKIPVVTSISPPYGSDQEVAFVTISGSAFLSGLTVRLERSTTVINGAVSSVAPGAINASFSLIGKPKGFYDLVVVNPGNHSTRVPTAFEINDAPHIISVSPNAADNLHLVNVTIAGSRFTAGATTKLTAAGQPDIVGIGVVVQAGGTSMTAAYDLHGRATGPRNVVVTNPNTLTGVLANGFTVSAMPTVAAITPTSGVQQQTVNATITGGGFLPGMLARLERFQAGEIPGTVTSIDSGAVAAHVAFEIGSALPGIYDVVVVNPGNLLQRLPGAFEVRTAPQVTSVVPDAALDSSPVTLEIAGAHLLPGATAQLSREGQADIAGSAVTIAPDGSSLAATFDVRGHATGPWTVRVTNPDLGVAAVPNGFTISKIPSVTAIVPALGTDMDVIATSISGTGFVEGMAVRIERAAGAPIPGELHGAFPEGSPASATFNLVDAPAGLYDVVILNPGGIEGRLTSAFEIRSVPHLIGFSPAFCYDTSEVVCTIDGRRFDPGATARLVSPSSPTIVGTSTVVTVDGTRMTTTFDLRGQPTGARALRIVQEDGTEIATSAPFWINSHTFVGVPSSAPSEDLALASVAPNPSRGPTTVTFALASESTVRVTVVDLMGREVAELASGAWPAGRHEARWDGRGRQGVAPTGMYFVHMRAAGRTFVKRFVVAR
jgi:FlgD Ig-like domain